MKKNALNWFEIPVNGFDQAVQFYEKMMNVSLQREQMDGIDMAIFPYDEDSVSGSLVKAGFLQPSDRGTLVYLNAEGFIDEAIARATAQGAEILMPKTAIGENGFIAHIRDCEGNRVGLHSMSA
jgi:predicted enzyme related to lactoylglutathione lyase